MWDKVKKAMWIAAGVRAQSGGHPVRLLPSDVAEAERVLGRRLLAPEEAELRDLMDETAKKEQR